MELRLMDKIRWFNTYLNMWRIFPAYICFLYNRFRQKCEEDLQVWVKHFHEVEGKTKLLQFGFLLINEKETRNVFLNRLHRNPVMFAVVRLFFSPLESLYILMPPERIGGGFYVQHGLSTIIGAKEIGKRCRIFQQVSVGYNGEDNPVIGDDVIISAGAIVIGDVHVGSNSLIGAGAVVIRDVPENAVVAGVPARCIKIKVEK